MDDYLIKLDESNRFIHIIITGTINRRSALKVILEASAEGARLGLNRYCMDLRSCRNNETILENYNFAYTDMKADTIDRTARVVLLVSPDDHSHDFIETLLRNSGLHVTLLYDDKQAVQHLTG